MRRMKKSRREKFELIGLCIGVLGAATAESDSLLIPFGFMAVAYVVYSVPTLLEKAYAFLVQREEARSWR